MVGRSNVEVCPDCAVVQGTRNSVRKSSWPGKVALSGGQGEEVEGEICAEQDREMRSEPGARGIRIRESGFMRPAVENEVEFQRRRAFRRSPSGRHIEDSAKYC